MDWTNLIQELGGGLSATVIIVLCWGYWRKDQQLAAKDERYIELALSTQKALSELTTAIRESRK